MFIKSNWCSTILNIFNALCCHYFWMIKRLSIYNNCFKPSDQNLWHGCLMIFQSIPQDTHVDRQPFLSFRRFSWPQLDYPDDYPSKKTQKAHYLLLSSESSQNLFLCPVSLSYLIYKDIMRMNLRVISDVPLSFSPKKREMKLIEFQHSHFCELKIFDANHFLNF